MAAESSGALLLAGAVLAGFAVFGSWLSLHDALTHRLPNRLTGAWFVASFLLLAALAVVLGRAGPMVGALAGSGLLGGAYLLLSLVSGGAMGMGDVKLAAVLGLNLGFFSLPALFLASVLSFVLASAFVLAGVLARKLSLKSAVPFGPFMVLGALGALLLA